MILGYTAAEVRAAEEPLLADGVPLMQHAAFALATRVAAELADRRGQVRGATVVALVGSGNNGGDALHAGAYLARRGVRVVAVCTTDEPHADGLAALRRAGGRAVRAVEPGAVDGGRGDGGRGDGGRGDGADGRVAAARAGDRPDDTAALPGVWLGDAVAEAYAADVVLDGLLGIGGRGAPRGIAGLLAGLLADLLESEDAGSAGGGPRSASKAGGGPLVVAVDVPSGVGVDDGSLPDGPVLPAGVTVTFGAAKPALLLPPASRRAGRVEVVDLGLALAERPAVARLAPADVAALWPVPGPEDHKYSRGVLGVVAGTPAYPGAAVLTVSAAALSGVGMVRYVGPSAVARSVLAARPEVVAGTGRVQAWLLGPGVDPGHAKQARRVTGALQAALAEGLPTVLDAGALALAPRELAPWCVLTPHAGELATLLGRLGEDVERAAVEAEPLRWARRAHELTGATVLLKGSTTVVVGAGGAVYAQADAPGWLATAGAGDVLAGVLGALLAGRAADVLDDPPLAAALAAAAALVHGRAAEEAVPGGPVTALGVAHAVPATVAGLLRG
ncbi:bifunctional ADP-dependent NAD(P)H-hydrate dehydratase/NAD(P)H-hydrate epimerase [Cellulomonas sp. PS-H5]|uniref:bifunctional ADP-dependent NAD(P)H-hydrate dehydratase/NAD(P)H-hydrate epimerase n=1 Tax=Cellulomonas sp. PS-H5 TaxID=2820400 RepID=UPI001C4EB88F|nr:bifunctional ADP-dependent NAD(P)H-hydrate dehydratase/NAD(P)H-hydrate epimerase [Cellulomonas sp. PS-H5]MBW0254365.1 bifunctional ADP-dependent NAD(P)H-hydrate dehydratase/NAD(P)H-hydrate epimerase [Cellulomonas sp. PS-H5]